jgi:anti-sigma B factor antagonist
MEINLREYVFRIHIIELSGRLDAFTVGKLRDTYQQFLDKDDSNFVIDLSQTDFMDSAGMAALVSLLKRSRQTGGDVVLVKPVDPAAYRILALTRFDQVFCLTDTVDEAIQKLR